MPTSTTKHVSAPDEVCQTDPIGAPREQCPTWCTDRDQPGGCDGMHWTAGDGVLPTLGRIDDPLAGKILCVYLHQDREDAEPHVLLNVFGGAGGALDCDARMAAGEARVLAALLIDAAAALEDQR